MLIYSECKNLAYTDLLNCKRLDMDHDGQAEVGYRTKFVGLATGYTEDAEQSNEIYSQEILRNLT